MMNGTRRTFARLIGSGLTCLLLLVAGGPRRLEAADRQHPNIVFVLIDDMGWPDVACYGHAFHETPVIDKLARQGVRFTDFYAATPVCSSTRSTIQTGQYSARTGITDFLPGHWRPFEKLVVPPIDAHLKEGLRTPGDALKQAGYVTGYFGKWHLGNGPRHAPDQHGYDVTERQLDPSLVPSIATEKRGPKSIDFLTDATLWFIERHRERPFFVTLSHQAVHIPLEARPATVEKYRAKQPPPDGVEKYRAKQPPPDGVNHPVYAAMIEDLDASIGRIVSKLDELQLTDNTVIVFTSDNGGLRTTFTGVGETVSTNAPLRDEKGSLYEGGIRVPLIVRWPGVVPAGTVCSQPTTTADLLPTFCELAGAKLPEQPVDGISLARLFREPAGSLERDAIFFHYPHYHHSRPAGAIRAGDWKLIEFFDDDSVELYNLRADLGERQNLAGAQADRAAHLRDRLAEWRKQVAARMPTANPQYDPDRAAEWWNRSTNKPIVARGGQGRVRTKKDNHRDTEDTERN